MQDGPTYSNIKVATGHDNNGLAVASTPTSVRLPLARCRRNQLCYEPFNGNRQHPTARKIPCDGSSQTVARFERNPNGTLDGGVHDSFVVIIGRAEAAGCTSPSQIFDLLTLTGSAPKQCHQLLALAPACLFDLEADSEYAFEMRVTNRYQRGCGP